MDDEMSKPLSHVLVDAARKGTLHTSIKKAMELMEEEENLNDPIIVAYLKVLDEFYERTKELAETTILYGWKGEIIATTTKSEDLLELLRRLRQPIA